MSSHDYQAGDATRNTSGLNDSLLDGALQHAGEINTGPPAIRLRAALLNSTPEWKCARLEPQVSQLLESMEGAVVAHDSGVIVGFNKRTPELLCCPAAKLLWRRLSKFIEPVSLPTLTRWIEASDNYSILVNGVRPGGDFLLLRLEAVAYLFCPGGRRVEVVALVEFGPRRGSPQLRESESASQVDRP